MRMKSYDNLKKSLRRRLSSKRSPLDTTTNFNTENNGAHTERVEIRLQSTGHATLECPNPKPGPSMGNPETYLDSKQHQRQVKVDSIIAKVYACLSKPLAPKDTNEFLILLEGLKALSTEVCNVPHHCFII